MGSPEGREAAETAADADGDLILFDGVCVLCGRLVDFVLERDPARRFRFAALQSPAGERVLRRFRMPAGMLTTMVLIEDGAVYTESTAALRVARRLRAAWPLLYLLIAVPRPLRDAVYRWVGANRLRWFGRRETCRLPTDADRGRFLE